MNAKIPHFSLSEFNTGGKVHKVFVRAFLSLVFGTPRDREENGESFSRKALSSCLELVLKATDFSPGGGRRPDCPPANKGP